MFNCVGNPPSPKKKNWREVMTSQLLSTFLGFNLSLKNQFNEWVLQHIIPNLKLYIQTKYFFTTFYLFFTFDQRDKSNLKNFHYKCYLVLNTVSVYSFKIIVIISLAQFLFMKISNTSSCNLNRLCI